MRTFKFYSPSKFQLYNTVLSTIVTILYIISFTGISLVQDFSTSAPLTLGIGYFFVGKEAAILYIVGCLAAYLPSTHQIDASNIPASN